MRDVERGQFLFAQAYLTSKFHHVEPAKAGDAKVWVKAASSLRFARLPNGFDKTASHLQAVLIFTTVPNT